MAVVAKTQIIEGRTYVVYTTGGGLVPGVTIAAMDEAPDGTWDVWVQDPATSHSRSYYGRKTRERAQAIVDRHLAKEGETVTAEETIGELPESIDLRPATPAPAEEAVEAVTVIQVNTVFEDELTGPDFTPRVEIEHPKGLTFAAWKAQNLTPDWSNWNISEGMDAGTMVFGYSAELPRRTTWVFVQLTH